MTTYYVATAAEVVTFTTTDTDEAVYRIKEIALAEINADIEANSAILHHYQMISNLPLVKKFHKIVEDNYEFKDMLEDADTLPWLLSLGVSYHY